MNRGRLTCRLLRRATGHRTIQDVKRLLLTLAVLGLTATACVGCSDPAGCQPRITRAEVTDDGLAVRLIATPAPCSVDFTDGGRLTVSISEGRSFSLTPLVSKGVRAAEDGSFETTVALPAALKDGWGHAYISSGFDAHASGDVNLKSVRFRVPQ